MTLTTSRSSWLSGDSPNTGSCLQLLLLPLLSAIDWGASHRSEVASTESKTSTNFKWRQQRRSKMDKTTATTAMCKWSCDHCDILTRFKLHRETPLALSTSVGLASSQSQLLLILFLVVLILLLVAFLLLLIFLVVAILFLVILLNIFPLQVWDHRWRR